MARRHLQVCIGLLGAAFAAAPGVASAYCTGWDNTLPNYDPHYYSPTHEFRRSKYVIKARVLRETWLGEDGKPKPLRPPFQFGEPRPWGFDPYAGAFYDVRVETAFKGQPRPVLRLFSENSTARFWLKVGSEHVLFVTDEAFDAPIGKSLTVDNCGNSTPVGKAGPLLRTLQRIASPVDR
jgi:hypothetical protein